MTVDMALGRWMAWVVHPQAAWRRLHPHGRAVLIGTYFGVGYLGGLVILIVSR